MKKLLLTLVCFAFFLLSGCSRDTVVVLPPEPEAPSSPTLPSPTEATRVPATQDGTQSSTESPPVTEATQVPTEPETQPPAQATQAPTTPDAPPVTQPTDPIATVPPATEPPAPPTVPATEPPGYATTVYNDSLLEAINAARLQNHLPPLTEDAALCDAAVLRARELPLELSHTRPDGRDWTTALADLGIPCRSHMAENTLSCSQGFTAETMVEGWMANPFSLEKLLNPNFTLVGLGVCCEKGMLYIVAIFAG